MSLTEIKCSNCNFKIIPDGANIFYIDHKTDELVEYMSLLLSKRDETYMWGHIEKTYCQNCDKLIKTYLIREFKYSKDESIIKLQKLLEKSDINEKNNIELLIEDAREYEKKVNNSKINCPQCGEKLYRNFQAEKCPICESKLILGISVDID